MYAIFEATNTRFCVRFHERFCDDGMNENRRQFSEISPFWAYFHADRFLSGLKSVWINPLGWITSSRRAGCFTVVELKRVIQEDIDDQEISDTLYDLAEKYGQTFENASTAASNFAKSGKNWQETIKATEAALLSMNVAELTAEESSTGLIAVMNQFGYGTEDLTHIIDVLNKRAYEMQKGKREPPEQADNRSAPPQNRCLPTPPRKAHWMSTQAFQAT